MKVVLARNFEIEARRLVKKYPSAASEIARLIEDLKQNPTMGTPIGRQCFKIRLAISSKGRGKSGGARVITCVLAVQETVTLLSIYDKSDQVDIPDSVLKKLIRENSF